MNHARMKYYLLIIVSFMLAGCSATSQQQEIDIFSSDVTYDEDIETVAILESDIDIADDFKESYPYTFSELYVRKDTGRELLRVDANGVMVESGETVTAQIATQAAYAVQFGTDDFMYIVQIDEAGVPVSEPLTINWNSDSQGWRFE